MNILIKLHNISDEIDRDITAGGIWEIMIINTNLDAMKSLRSLDVNNRKNNKVMEKLSSGLKINRAADDSAGLAISTKMRAQIRGLAQDERNIDDGISMFNTAEGGMEQIENMIHRIRELAVQSASDTNTDDDRVLLQKEVGQLIKGIDKIASDTEFNTHKVLQGKGGETVTIPSILKSKKTLEESYNALLKSVILKPNPNLLPHDSSTTDPSKSQSIATYFIVDGHSVPPGAVNASGVENVSNFTPLMDYFLHDTDSNFENFIHTMDPNNIDDAKHFINTIATAMNKIIDYYYPGGGLPEVKGYVFESTGHVGLYLSDGTNLTWGTCNSGWISPTYNTIAHNYLHEDFAGGGEVSGYELTAEPQRYIIQVGPNTDQNIPFEIPPMPADLFPKPPDEVIANADISTRTKANDTIVLCDKALDYVNSGRSLMGAHVNRLEAAKSNVTNTHQNMSAAESRLRDANMSKEMMEQVKGNILTQAATAMLAQANQRPEGVLQLLR